MLAEGLEWMRKLLLSRKIESLTGMVPAKNGVTYAQLPTVDGGADVLAFVGKRRTSVTVRDEDSFVMAVKTAYHHRYGSLPFEGPQEPDKTPIVHRPMPVIVCVSEDSVVARLAPTDECRTKAACRVQHAANADDVIQWKLTPSVAWQRLVAYSTGSRLKQADIVREWEDVWQDATYHRLADSFRRIEIQTRNEVHTGPRRDAGLQEFVTNTADELPETLELSVDRWAEYELRSSKPNVKVRIHIERTTPPLVAFIPVVGMLDKATVKSVETLRRSLESEFRELGIPVVAGSFGSSNDD